MGSEVCHGIRGLSWDPRFVMGSEVCHEIRGLSWNPRFVMGSEVCHGIRGLSWDPRFVMGFLIISMQLPEKGLDLGHDYFLIRISKFL
jgi:hypothetical protein